MRDDVDIKTSIRLILGTAAVLLAFAIQPASAATGNITPHDAGAAVKPKSAARPLHPGHPAATHPAATPAKPAQIHGHPATRPIQPRNAGQSGRLEQKIKTRHGN